VSTIGESIDRIAPAHRPNARPAGYHRWWDLTFLHWRVPPESLRPLIPDRLAIDTWEGDAWVGLVPFRMSGLRPWWFPALPGISAFHETNVRTYVHCRGKDPGVWFFSLDAASWLGVRVARWRWHLPYHDARMRHDRHGNRIHYRSRRVVDRHPAEVDLEIELGSQLGGGQPGSLEHFLIERYLLYCESSNGTLYRGQVHHRPYSLQEADVVRLEETLLAANRIERTGPPNHVSYSPGVEVDVFPIRPVA